ncbi:MAG: BMC domain-containing protein [Desulfuromusa sp.]|nr:BMC domain-containing protein [Desulfuromusa sp.]
MSLDTLGLVESRTVAAGIFLADLMVKAAEVKLVRAATICAGRYFIQVSGTRSAVEMAVASAEASDYSLVGNFVISNVHPDLLRRGGKCQDIPAGDALGVVECKTVSAGVIAADQALKKADVQLAKLVIGQGISGKSYFILNGDIAEVTEAVAAARDALDRYLLETVIIPAPDEAIIAALLNKLR